MNISRFRSVLAAVVCVLGSAGTAVQAQAQGAVITGRVVADDGRELVGANVLIPELNISIATTEGGRFTITVPDARVSNQAITVRARAIGYVPTFQAATLRAGTQTINFALRTDVNRLEEVVITGVSGATQQTRVPFKVERITAADMPVPQADPMRQLQGKVAGARIVSASGRPGQAPSVLLRAPTSINGTGRGQDPLYIIDGVILDGAMSNINAEDIESIEVVKGAAAASLYGARAGNGVIQIRTKTGANATEGVRFNFRTEIGTADIPGDVGLAKSHGFLLDETRTLFCVDLACNRRVNWENEVARINEILPGQTRTIATAGFPIDATTVLSAHSQRHAFLVNRWPEPTFNPAKDFVNPGGTVTAQLDMTGKVGGTGFYSSINRTDIGGAFPGLEGMQRSSARVNLDQQIGTKWNAALRTYYAREQEDGSQFEGGAGFAPFFRITRQNRKTNLGARDSQGRLIVRTNLASAGSQNINPLMVLDEEWRKDVTERFLGGATLRYTPLSWLDLEGNYSYDANSSRAHQQADKGFRNSGFQSSYERGYVFIANSTGRAFNTSMDVTARKSFGDLNTRTSLRYLFERQDNTTNSLTGELLAVSGLATANAIADQTSKQLASGEQSVRGIGFFINESLEWKERYILEGLIRRDGSSLFGRANRWQTFGRISAAWRLAQEPWWFIPAADEFKLRYSRGTAGGRPNFAAQYETFAISAAGTVTPFTAGNRFLGPEINTEDEFGLDMQLLRRFGLSLTVANSEVRNQILLVPAPSATGFLNQWRNAGTLENKSFEASLNFPIITNRSMNWTTRLTYDRVRSTITKLDVPPFTYGVNAQALAAIFKAEVGEQIGTFYGRAWMKNCSQLPTQFQANCGSPTSAFQVNDDGWLVWVGQGNNIGDGITKNLWGTTLHCPAGVAQGTTSATTGSALCTTSPTNYPLHWGMPVLITDSIGIAEQVAVGNALPDYKWGVSSTFNWKGFNVYTLFDAAMGNEVYNQGRHWSYLESANLDQDQAGKSVQTAKPLGYYWRASAPASTGLGGFYDVLAPNNGSVEDASFVKLRELSIGYDLGRLPLFRGDWRVNVIGRNLKTWTDYRGWDPEVGHLSGAPAGTNSTGSGVINAVDAFSFPNLRTFTFSISTTF